MGTKILHVTFRDGTRMYGQYSTVADRADTDIVCCQAATGEPSNEEMQALACQRPDRALFLSVDEEIVQCEVLHYGDVSEFTAWASTAKRIGKFGEITGATHGEEYRGDVAEVAHAMNLQLEAATTPTKRRGGRIRTFVQRLI